VDGQPAVTDTDYSGASFHVDTSNAVLVPVVYDPRYFEQIQGNTSSSPEEYLRAVVTYPSEVFTPTTSNPAGPGNYQAFAGGFDEMMGVRHVFHAFQGFAKPSGQGQGWCEAAAASARTALNMAADWNRQPAQTRPERHGFDYLIALTPDMGGGVTCGWLDVQVSSLINRDLARQQIVAVHETGHIFGAPHCDDLGDGMGGKLQGYVMCAGEKNPHYPAAFVWHSSSISQMRAHWD
jgi:hypothetical protein